jgi:hypothetical protein
MQNRFDSIERVCGTSIANGSLRKEQQSPISTQVGFSHALEREIRLPQLPFFSNSCKLDIV